MIVIDILKEKDFFLPEDGEVARATFLELLAMPTETWGSFYGFNMKSAFDIIKSNDAKGVAYHLLLDYLQSQGPSAKPLLHDFNLAKKVSEITLTTAGVGSKKTSQIWHWKGFVKLAEDGGAPWCWEGSTNMSDSGWYQGNSCRLFRSQEWADEFRRQHKIHTDWARANHACYQATILEVGGEIDAYFDALTETLSDEEIANIIANPELMTPEYARAAFEQLANLRGIK